MKNKLGDLKILKAYRLCTPKTISIKANAHRSLVIRLNQRLDYARDCGNLTTLRGDAVFIPRGANYAAKPVGGNNDYMIVWFETDDDGEWELMHVDDIAEAEAVHSELCRALVFDDEKSRMRALSLFYRLLSLISAGATAERYLDSRKLAMIRPALDHLEQAIYSPALSLGSLAELSGISDVYFREIFKAYTGMQPQKYVMAKRLNRARSLIEGGEVTLIKEAAELVGYHDPLYFSRIYKSFFGSSPTAALKKDRERKEEISKKT